MGVSYQKKKERRKRKFALKTFIFCSFWGDNRNIYYWNIDVERTIFALWITAWTMLVINGLANKLEL
jgi:hypothetical protein